MIASDKTGTLTRNEMTVRVVVTASGRATFEARGMRQTERSSEMTADIDGPLV